MKTKKELVAGVKYRGYGILNEFGEFEFIPEETGSRKGRQKIIKSDKDYTISETKNLVVVHISIDKKDSKHELVKSYLETVNKTLEILYEYAI